MTPAPEFDALVLEYPAYITEPLTVTAPPLVGAVPLATVDGLFTASSLPPAK